jgi:hypothetical protein
MSVLCEWGPGRATTSPLCGWSGQVHALFCRLGYPYMTVDSNGVGGSHRDSWTVVPGQVAPGPRLLGLRTTSGSWSVPCAFNATGGSNSIESNATQAENARLRCYSRFPFLVLVLLLNIRISAPLECTLVRTMASSWSHFTVSNYHWIHSVF